jgi:hypothetical protein
MSFDIIGEITDIEVIAAGSGIRDVKRLQKHYGKGRWPKLKGSAYTSDSLTAGSGWRNYIGMKRMVSGKRKSNANATWMKPYDENKTRDARIRRLCQ